MQSKVPRFKAGDFYYRLCCPEGQFLFYFLCPGGQFDYCFYSSCAPFFLVISCV